VIFITNVPRHIPDLEIASLYLALLLKVSMFGDVFLHPDHIAL